MCQWIGPALIQITAWRRIGTKRLWWVVVDWTRRNRLQRNFNQYTKLFIHKNAAYNIVCEMAAILSRLRWVNTLRPRQDGRHFADDIFMCIFVNENCCILIKISLKCVRKGPIDNNPALVQIMAWHLSGDKPLSEPMMVILLTHISVIRPQWVYVGCYHPCVVKSSI